MHSPKDREAPNTPPTVEEVATFGAGCFWCVEAVFQHLPGVLEATPGYMGGHTEKPTYEEVVTGETGHAEVVRVRFDPRVISYEQVLDLFWRMHDPTTRNRQGHDHGTQYRSVIFHHTEEQRRLATASAKALDESGELPRPVVTEIVPADIFTPAEPYHHNYYDRNANAPYCQIVIRPKLETLAARDG